MSAIHKSGELSRRLGIHENTVRTWADQYAAFMSKGALAAKRKFTDHDALVLATVARLREQGVKPEQIVKALENGQLVDDLPPLATPEEEAARQSIALVPMPEYERVLDRVKLLTSELEQVRAERDKAIGTWQADTTALNKRIAELEFELGEAKGKLAERLPQRVVLQIVIAVGGVLFLLFAALVLWVLSRGV